VKKEPTDYSGEFDPNLNLQDFSKGTLVKLLGVYARLYQALDGFWYLSVKDAVNNDIALACDLQVWAKQTQYELARLCKVMRIPRDGVAGVMKALQVGPWFFTHDMRIDLKTNDRAVLTIAYCPTLEALEREGSGREASICREVDPQIKRKFASFFDPAIEVVPLKLPPRQGKDGICCQWEFRRGGSSPLEE
jgi:hypothetical protein